MSATDRKPNHPIPEWVCVGAKVRCKISGSYGEVVTIDEYFVDIKYARSREINHTARDNFDHYWYQPKSVPADSFSGMN